MRVSSLGRLYQKNFVLVNTKHVQEGGWGECLIHHSEKRKTKEKSTYSIMRDTYPHLTPGSFFLGATKILTARFGNPRQRTDMFLLGEIFSLRE